MDAAGIVILIVFAAGIASVWPSWRGHWSGPALALPALVLGVLLFIAILREGGRIHAIIWGFDLLLLASGSGSIALWLWRRRWRPAWLRRSDEPHTSARR